jgi:1,4-alpha-glucan branching enzyme
MAMTKRKATGLTTAWLPGKKRVAFKIAAPDASDIYVAGDFNDWDRTSHPLKCNSRGMWNTSIALPPGKHEYRFLIDGEWQNDPNCSTVVPNAFGSYNCAIVLE